MFKPKSPCCQSCGMPLSKDEMSSGTEADGKKSTSIAATALSMDFTEPELDAEQMAERVRAKMRQMHIPGFLAKSFTKDIPKLGRWAGR